MPTATSHVADSSLDAALSAVWKRHRPDVLERLSLVEGAATALTAGVLDERLRREAQRTAHTLVGSVGTFGFARAARAARALELRLADPRPADAPSISALIVTMRDELEGGGCD